MTGRDGPSEDDRASDAERSETPAERLDRNWSELLQELRVTQTGIQILSGFLLILPFQSRFPDLDPALVWVYLGALVMGTLSTALVVAPVAAHRLLFRQRLKGTVVASGDLMAKAGLVCLALAVVQVLALVIGFVLGTTNGLIAGGVTLAVFVVLWLVVPLSLARANGRHQDD